MKRVNPFNDFLGLSSGVTKPNLGHRQLAVITRRAVLGVPHRQHLDRMEKIVQAAAFDFHRDFVKVVLIPNFALVDRAVFLVEMGMALFLHAWLQVNAFRHPRHCFHRIFIFRPFTPAPAEMALAVHISDLSCKVLLYSRGRAALGWNFNQT